MAACAACRRAGLFLLLLARSIPPQSMLQLSIARFKLVPPLHFCLQPAPPDLYKFLHLAVFNIKTSSLQEDTECQPCKEPHDESAPERQGSLRLRATRRDLLSGAQLRAISRTGRGSLSLVARVVSGRHAWLRRRLRFLSGTWRASRRFRDRPRRFFRRRLHVPLEPVRRQFSVICRTFHPLECKFLQIGRRLPGWGASTSGTGGAG